MRSLVRRMCNQRCLCVLKEHDIPLLTELRRHVLNCFSYSGSFSVSALAGGAFSTTSVDISSEAIDYTKRNVSLNGFRVGKDLLLVEAISFTHWTRQMIKSVLWRMCSNICDVQKRCLITSLLPSWIRQPLPRRKTTECRHAVATRISIGTTPVMPVTTVGGDTHSTLVARLILSKLPSNSFLLTSSCSHFVDRELFQKVVWQASVEAKRRYANSPLAIPDLTFNTFNGLACRLLVVITTQSTTRSVSAIRRETISRACSCA